MNHRSRLLQRLDEVGASLAASGHGLALLALGSVGLELDRLDEHSDLDFFAVVEPGHKPAYLADLGWLAAVAPVGYAVRNTPDGYKLLFADGIFCEFAVFEPAELAAIPFAAGRVVWARSDVDDSVLRPRHTPSPAPLDVEWQLGEALSNLYVGLGRFRRGEKLSAARFVQGLAVDRVLDLAAAIEDEEPAHRDPYVPDRRFERRFPGTAAQLPRFVPGYDHTPAAALAILAFLDAHFAVNPHIKAAVLALCDADDGAVA